MLAKAAEHGRTLVKDDPVALENAARAARIVAFINYQHPQPAFGKQSGRR